MLKTALTPINLIILRPPAIHRIQPLNLKETDNSLGRTLLPPLKILKQELVRLSYLFSLRRIPKNINKRIHRNPPRFPLHINILPPFMDW
jgi:hypothetical protein